MASSDFSDRRPRILGVNEFRFVETVDCPDHCVVYQQVSMDSPLQSLTHAPKPAWCLCMEVSQHKYRAMIRCLRADRGYRTQQMAFGPTLIFVHVDVGDHVVVG